LLYIVYKLLLLVPVIHLFYTERSPITDGTDLFSFHPSNVDSSITDLHTAL